MTVIVINCKRVLMPNTLPPHLLSALASTKEWVDIWQKCTQQAQKAYLKFSEAKDFQDITSKVMGHPLSIFDPPIIQKVMIEAAQKIAQNPDHLINVCHEFMAKSGFLGESPYNMPTSPSDKRFKDPAWEKDPYFKYLKDSYFLISSTLSDLVEGIKDLDPAVHRKLKFYIQQWSDACSPTNFPLTNPEVLRETWNLKGQNLVKGVENFLKDLDQSQGSLAIRMTDMEGFKVGVNLATTPGSIIYQNAFFQLIRYEPRTKKTYEAPLLIIPPWINKYYVFDLKEENSFVRWALEQGLSVYMISWVNPDHRYRDCTLDHYVLEGIKEAIESVLTYTDEDSLNVVGYCAGGIGTVCLLSYLHETGQDHLVKSATIIASPIDCSEAGNLLVYICEEQLSKLEEHVTKAGYLDGKALMQSFSLLRARDLIWSYYINNYLLGREPFPFDLLFWNCDSTNIPARMHIEYLRDFFLHNKLMTAGGVSIGGVDLDIQKIKTPLFCLATSEDHIAPWPSLYPLFHLTEGKNKFILAGSGHVAGVFNPPSKNKYSFWTSESSPPSPQEWLEQAEEVAGSWWPTWLQWTKEHSGKKISSFQTPPKEIIEAAPGKYVTPILTT